MCRRVLFPVWVTASCLMLIIRADGCHVWERVMLLHGNASGWNMQADRQLSVLHYIYDVCPSYSEGCYLHSFSTLWYRVQAVFISVNIMLYSLSWVNLNPPTNVSLNSNHPFNIMLKDISLCWKPAAAKLPGLFLPAECCHLVAQTTEAVFYVHR